MNNIEPWLSVEQISVHLSVSKETVYRWLERQKIPASRIGKLWRFRASKVDEWVAMGGADLMHISKSSKHSARKT